ncbi:hypothetical protein QW131_00195 [Roseibium salinum]|nr:hypothetical protein [Roseibium salinum]
MYALSDLEALLPVVDDLRTACEAQGIPADAAVSEAAPGQFELNLHHRRNPLLAADDVVMLRRLVAGVARKHQLKASFMAKPFVEWPGNGMHVHVSMEDEKGNFFADPDKGGERLHFAINGLFENHAGGVAPLHLHLQRLPPHAARAPMRLPRSAGASTTAPLRCAFRHPARKPPAWSTGSRGADANPYLVLTGILAGMMEGLRLKKDPPAPVTGNAYEKRKKRLTPWMDEAIDAFEASRLMKQAVGKRDAQGPDRDQAGGA